LPCAEDDFSGVAAPRLMARFSQEDVDKKYTHAVSFVCAAHARVI
jgi:hypothetical protein